MVGLLPSERLDGVSNSLRHVYSADFGFALFASEDVTSAQALVDGLIHGSLNGGCGVAFAKRVA